jgi:hypothetical protein
MASATPSEIRQAKMPEHLNNKTLEDSVCHPKRPKVAGAVIKAERKRGVKTTRRLLWIYRRHTPPSGACSATLGSVVADLE